MGSVPRQTSGDFGTIQSALEKVGPSTANRTKGLAGDLAALVDTIKRYPWTTLASLKGDSNVLGTLDEAEKVLAALKKQLSD